MKLDRFTVGKRYGKAIFQLAVESEKLDEIYAELMSLREVYEQVPELGEILTDVRLENHEKAPLVDSLKNGFSDIVKNFIDVVNEYNRLNNLPLMIDEFERRYNEQLGIVTGTVTTVVPLSAEQKAKLEEKFAKYTGHKKAYLKAEIDPEIIGGVIVEANHQVIDGSIRTQLSAIERALLK